MQNITDISKVSAEEVTSFLSEFLPASEEYGKLCEAMNYSVLNGGKRLRAIMLLEAFDMFSRDKAVKQMLAVPFAAALEFVHAYSLVHDDLPEMDNDVLRRGKPTTHVAYGHAMGTLTGDALLNYAFETIANIFDKIENSLSDKEKLTYYPRILKASKVFAEKAGYSGMIGGQVLDTSTPYNSTEDYTAFFPEADSCIETTECDINKVKYCLRIYELKTSQLIETALMCGGILAGADSVQTEHLELAGKYLGLAFQIQDDVLDITSTSEITGKSTGIDSKNSKSTVAGLIGLEASGKLIEKYTESAVNNLLSASENSAVLKELFDSLINRKK